MTPILSLFAPLALAGALSGTPNFDAAVTAYGELDYEGALAKFKTTDTASDDAERATVLMWIALCDAGIGDLEAARVSMREALRLDRDVSLPTTVSPRVVAIYDEEKAALPQDSVVEPPPSGAAAPRELPPAFDFAAVPPLAWVGGASVAVGVVALGGSALWAAGAFEQLAIVDAPGTFQDDAKVALDAANFNAGLAVGAGVVGVGLAGLGVVLLAMSAPEEAARAPARDALGLDAVEAPAAATPTDPAPAPTP